MSTPAPISAAAGWYPDPYAQAGLRYHDGARWTQHVAPYPAAASPSPATSAFSAGAASFGAPPWAAAPTSVGTGPSDPVHWLIPTGRTWQSIVAGYVGLAAIVLWFLGPVALGLGIWAIRASERSGAHGRGRAIFAIAVGAASTLGMLAVIIGLA